MRPRTVFFMLYDGCVALDVVGPADVFSEANRQCQTTYFKLRFVSDEPEVRTSNGLRLRAEPLDEAAVGADDMIMLPGANEEPLRKAVHNPKVRAWVSQAAQHAFRVCSVCSGAFFLADLGLIEGRRATTHWRALDRLKQWPGGPEVDSDALFTEDGRFWASAGVSSGMDMALAIVERDLGRPTALKIARELVLFLVRPGGQSQFSKPLDFQERSAASDLRRLPFWLAEQLTMPISVEDMAKAMGMSPRTLHRKCLAVFGETPLGILTTVRVDRARALLEDGHLPMKAVAAEAGFSDPAAMRRVFAERLRVSPSDYRRCFGSER